MLRDDLTFSRVKNTFEVSYEKDSYLVKMANLDGHLFIQDYSKVDGLELQIWKAAIGAKTINDLIKEISFGTDAGEQANNADLKELILRLADKQLLSISSSSNYYERPLGKDQLSVPGMVSEISSRFSTPYTLEQTVLLESLRRYKRVVMLLHGNSMEPMIRAGSMVLVRSAKPGSVRIGDVVVCFKGKDIIAHRLIKKVFINHNLYILTKGDNCDAPDPPMEGCRLVAKVVKRIEGEVFENGGRLFYSPKYHHPGRGRRYTPIQQRHRRY